MSGKIHGDHAARVASYVVWGIGLLLFLLFELSGIAHRWVPRVPWFSLSETDWSVMQVLPPWARWLARVLLLGFFTSLGAHFGFGTPLLP